MLTAHRPDHLNGPWPRLVRWAALTFLMALLCGGCRADVGVRIKSKGDRGGAVEVDLALDPEATARVGDMDASLQVTDLRQAGWSVLAPRRRSDGWTWVRARKKFADREGAGRAIAEVGGPSGPFAGLRLSNQHSFFRSRAQLEGTVDLRSGLASLGDDDLRRRFLGAFRPIPGQDSTSLAQQLESLASRSLSLRLVAEMPGQLRSNAPRRRGGQVEWPLPLGQATWVTVQSEAWNLRRLVFSLLASVAFVVLVVMTAARLLIGRRHGSNPLERATVEDRPSGCSSPSAWEGAPAAQAEAKEEAAEKGEPAT